MKGYLYAPMRSLSLSFHTWNCEDTCKLESKAKLLLVASLEMHLQNSNGYTFCLLWVATDEGPPSETSCIIRPWTTFAQMMSLRQSINVIMNLYSVIVTSILRAGVRSVLYASVLSNGHVCCAGGSRSLSPTNWAEQSTELSVKPSVKETCGEPTSQSCTVSKYVIRKPSIVRRKWRSLPTTVAEMYPDLSLLRARWENSKAKHTFWCSCLLLWEWNYSRTSPPPVPSCTRS